MATERDPAKVSVGLQVCEMDSQKSVKYLSFCNFLRRRRKSKQILLIGKPQVEPVHRDEKNQTVILVTRQNVVSQQEFYNAF